MGGTEWSDVEVECLMKLVRSSQKKQERKRFCDITEEYNALAKKNAWQERTERSIKAVWHRKENKLVHWTPIANECLKKIVRESSETLAWDEIARRLQVVCPSLPSARSAQACRNQYNALEARLVADRQCRSSKAPRPTSVLRGFDKPDASQVGQAFQHDPILMQLTPHLYAFYPCDDAQVSAEQEEDQEQAATSAGHKKRRLGVSYPGVQVHVRGRSALGQLGSAVLTLETLLGRRRVCGDARKLKDAPQIADIDARKRRKRELVQHSRERFAPRLRSRDGGEVWIMPPGSEIMIPETRESPVRIRGKRYLRESPAASSRLVLGERFCRSLLFLLAVCDRAWVGLFVEDLLEDYGQSPECCLRSKEAGREPAVCRHCLYTTNGIVYQTGYRSYEDYRMALVLGLHMECCMAFKARQGNSQPTKHLEKVVRVVSETQLCESLAHKIISRPVNECLSSLRIIEIQDNDAPLGKDEETCLLDLAFGILSFSAADGTTNSVPGLMVSKKTRLFIIPIAAKNERNVRTSEAPTATWAPRFCFSRLLRRYRALRATHDFAISHCLYRRLKSQRRYVPRHQGNRVDAAIDFVCEKYGLNERQEEVVFAALCRQGVLRVHGIIGCGKSTMIIAVIHAYRIAYPMERVLVTAETNAVLNEAVHRFDQLGPRYGLELLRIGGYKSAPPCIHRHFLEKQVEDHQQASRVRQQPDARVSSAKKRQDIIHKASIIACTLSCASEQAFMNEEFGCVVVDEAGRVHSCSVPQAIRRSTNVLILVGDPLQSGPSSDLPLDQVQRYRTAPSHLKSTDHHAIESVLSHGGAEFDFTLDIQYSCHPQIGQLVNGLYSSEVKHMVSPLFASDDYLAEMELSSRESIKVLSQRTFFYDCAPPASTLRDDAKELRGMCATDPHAMKIVQVVHLLVRIGRILKSKRVKKSLLVVIPYEAQKRLLETCLRKDCSEHWQETLVVCVGTIDHVQGSEFDIVVCWLEQDEHSSRAFSPTAPALVVVPLSCARDYLFAIGEIDSLRRDACWAKVLATAGEVSILSLSLETPGIENLNKHIFNFC